MTAPYFKEIESKYPITSQSPDRQWEYKIEYEQGWGGYTLHYKWHLIDSKEWHQRKDVYYLANYADGNMDGYESVEWKKGAKATLVFKLYDNSDIQLLDVLELPLTSSFSPTVTIDKPIPATKYDESSIIDISGHI